MPKDRTPAPYRDLSALLRDAGMPRGDEAQNEQTRARVVRALGSFQRAGKSRMQAARVERQLAIITRCDLGGQLHKVVAADLGISMRTFYRERVEAFKHLRKAIASEPRQAAAPPPPSATAVHLERARVLGAQGSLHEAVARLSELPGSEGEALLAVALGARLAGLWLRLGDTERSAQAVARAKRCAALLGNGGHHGVAVAEIGLVEAARLSLDGRYGMALTAAGRLTDSAQLRSSYTTPDGTDAAHAAYVFHVDACLEVGATERARSLLAEFRPILQSRRCPADVRLELTLAGAELELLAGADPARPLRAAVEASSEASAERLTRAFVRAQRVIALASNALGDANSARTSLSTAASSIAESLLGTDARTAALSLCAAAVDVGDAPLAVRALETAGAARTAEESSSPLALLRQAETLVLQRRYREGVKLAREANQLLSHSGSRRYVGETLLALASGLAGCGEQRPARSAATEAATLLEGSSWPWRVREAQWLAGRAELGDSSSFLQRRRLERQLTAS